MRNQRRPARARSIAGRLAELGGWGRARGSFEAYRRSRRRRLGIRSIIVDLPATILLDKDDPILRMDDGSGASSLL
jgi:hypothetical protein